MPDSLFKFTRSYRLVSKHDFQSVFANPQKVSRPFLLALYRANHLPHARLGIMISKHHAKRAVERTRLRRIIRESFRHYLVALKGFDMVVMLRRECSALEKKDFRQAIDSLWEAIERKK